MFGRRKSSGGDTDAGVSRVAETRDRYVVGEGPHDRSDVGDLDAYFSEAGFGYLDLNSMVIGIPPGTELNVTLGPEGIPEFHVVSQIARVIPHVFAAPKSSGQWRTWVTDLRTSLEAQDADVSIADGPWGRELSADLPGAVFHAIGVDGPRWMAEVRVMSTPEHSAAAAEQAREVLRHLIVSRGSDPLPAREHLAVVVPEDVQLALAQAQGQLAEQAREQAYAEQMAAAQHQGGGAADSSPPQGPVGTAGTEAVDTPPSSPESRHRGKSAMDSLRDDAL